MEEFLFWMELVGELEGIAQVVVVREVVEYKMAEGVEYMVREVVEYMRVVVEVGKHLLVKIL